MNVSTVLSRLAGNARSLWATPASQEDRNIRNLYIDTAWQGVWSAGMGAFLSVFMARLDASSFLISALTSAPALITILLSMPAAAYVERQRDHVRVTTIYRLLFRLTYLIVAILPFFFLKELPLLIVILWTLQAIPAAIVNLSWTSVIGAILSPRRRPRVNGGRWAVVSFVVAVMVIPFGKLLDAPFLPFPLNYQIVFFISTAAMVMSVIYFARIVMPAVAPAAEPAKAPLRQRIAGLLNPLIHNRRFLQYIGATFVVRAGLNMPAALYSIYWVRNMGATDTAISLRTTAGQAALVVGYYLFGRLASRRGHRWILILSSVGIGLYPVVTGLSADPLWLAPAALIWGFFAGGIDISFFEGLLQIAPRDKLPTFAALNTVFANIAAFVAPLVGSLLMEALGIQPAFFIAGALHLIGAALCWRLGVGDLTNTASNGTIAPVVEGE
jgi:MFS family permease